MRVMSGGGGVQDVPRARRAEIGLCLLLACADGEISDAEVGALSAEVGALLGDLVSPYLMHEILLVEMASLDAIGPDDYMASLAERLPEGGPDRARALANALRVAVADGLSDDERQSFREAATALGFEAAYAENVLAKALSSRSDLPPWSASEPPGPETPGTSGT
jgi:tellurite resistance protein